MNLKRFVETISTGVVTDKKTGKDYKCEMRINDELLEVINDLDKENSFFKKKIAMLEETCKVYDDFIKKQGYTVVDIWKGFKNDRK